MKKILLLVFLSCMIVRAQEKWSTKKAMITFEASVPFFEPIQATNKTVSCLLNVKKSSIAFVVNIKDFRFERSLMERHFNENYLESRKYPRAVFKGSIENFELTTLNSTPVLYMIVGTITIHGKSKKIVVPGSFTKTGKVVELKTSFDLLTDDFDISIPFLVKDKIAKNVHVNLNARLE